jgi:D-xylose transport system permease protein
VSAAAEKAAPKPDAPAGLRARLAAGDLGSAPVLVGLFAIWAAFAAANDRFLSAVNLTNLVLQIAASGTISVGLVLVLLLGEIDLSAGVLSGLAAAVTAVLNVKAGWSGPASVAAGLAVGALVGAFHGLWVARLRVPSFVVTLAGLLGWQGALLLTLGDSGTVNLGDAFIVSLAGTFFDPPLALAFGAAAVLAYAASIFVGRRRRQAAGLPLGPLGPELGRLAATSVAIVVAVTAFALDRGLPLAALFFLGLLVAVEALLRKTRFGRHIFAVGGNAEAARRAGIRVRTVRVAAFALAGALAATGGILAASRLLAVNQSSGGGDVLLNAVAAAVIGGTSLFGGRGSAWSALLGALVIGSISNGMDLLALPSSVKFVVTGAVLLIAASVDALSRRDTGRGGRR